MGTTTDRSPKLAVRTLIVGIGAVLVVGLQVAILFLQLPRFYDKETHPHAAALVGGAKSAFSQQNDDLGIALLASGLMVTPDDDDALDLYRNRLTLRLEEALNAKEWDVVDVQITAYDSALRDALQATSTPEGVQRVVDRRKQLQQWAQRLQNKLEAEMADLRMQFQDAIAEQLSGLEQRIASIPAHRLDDAGKEELAALAHNLVNRQDQERFSDLRNRFTDLETRAKAEDASTNDLRTLQVEAERLHADAVEFELNGANAQEFLGSCRSLLSQLDQRVQVRSVREMQTIADAEARQSLQAARALHQEAQEFAKDRKQTWQSAGERLVDAELQLARIDRLASFAIQQEARKLAEGIKKDSLVYRAKQQRAYNVWAIEQLEASISDFRDARGILNDDEDTFMEILETRIGQIDPLHLHPVTHSLFSEMYQTLIAELDNPRRVEITKAIERADRKPLSDF